MKKTVFKTIGWTALVALTAVMLIPQTVSAIEFDPNGNIESATQLPDKSPTEITIITIQWVLGFMGLIAVIMMLYGGFTWMTSSGNEEKVIKAKNILKHAIIGMVVVLLSWAAVIFVFERIVASTS